MGYSITNKGREKLHLENFKCQGKNVLTGVILEVISHSSTVPSTALLNQALQPSQTTISSTGANASGNVNLLHQKDKKEIIGFDERSEREDYKNYLDHVYAVSDDNANIIEHYRYTAFGEVEVFDSGSNQIANTAINNNVTWNSRRYDNESGLHYYKYRHYIPRLGRWLGRDPIEEEGGVNLYNFVGNDAVNLWDRFGLDEGSSLGDIIGNLIDDHLEKTKEILDDHAWAQKNCCGDTKAVAEAIRDDAGVRCCAGDTKEVELRIDDALAGHVWLQWSIYSLIPVGFGHYPDDIADVMRDPISDWQNGRRVPGGIRYDGLKPYDRLITYTLCSETFDKLKENIFDNANNQYDLSNTKSENCVGWACNRLKDVGITPPLDTHCKRCRPSKIRGGKNGPGTPDGSGRGGKKGRLADRM